MITLLFFVLILGVIAYIISAVPLAQPFRAVAYGIVVIILLVYVARFLGHPLDLPR